MGKNQNYIYRDITVKEIVPYNKYYSSAGRLVLVKVVRNSHITIQSLLAGKLVLVKVVRNFHNTIRSSSSGRCV